MLREGVEPSVVGVSLHSSLGSFQGSKCVRSGGSIMLGKWPLQINTTTLFMPHLESLDVFVVHCSLGVSYIRCVGTHVWPYSVTNILLNCGNFVISVVDTVTQNSVGGGANSIFGQCDTAWYFITGINERACAYGDIWELLHHEGIKLGYSQFSRQLYSNNYTCWYPARDGKLLTCWYNNYFNVIVCDFDMSLVFKSFMDAARFV